MKSVLLDKLPFNNGGGNRSAWSEKISGEGQPWRQRKQPVCWPWRKRPRPSSISSWPCGTCPLLLAPFLSRIRKSGWSQFSGQWAFRCEIKVMTEKTSTQLSSFLEWWRLMKVSVPFPQGQELWQPIQQDQLLHRIWTKKGNYWQVEKEGIIAYTGPKKICWPTNLNMFTNRWKRESRWRDVRIIRGVGQGLETRHDREASLVAQVRFPSNCVVVHSLHPSYSEQWGGAKTHEDCWKLFCLRAASFPPTLTG